MENQKNNLEQKWWFRVAKVVYIFLYLLLVIGLIAGGIDNFYSYGDGTITYTPWFAVANVLIGGIIGLAMIKVVKIIFFYIFLAQKPHWKRELTNIF